MIEPFTITSRIGTVDRCAVTATATWDGTRLALVGEIKHHRANGAREAGQILDTVRKINPRLADLWERWHLNDMRAGCSHQEEAFRAGATRPTHSNNYEGKETPCPECGYKYGSAWNHEDVPDAVLIEIKDLLRGDLTI